MTTRKDALNWFEIFTADFARAKQFYEAILDAKLQDVPASSCESSRDSWTHMAVFPYATTQGVGGAITQMNGVAPGGGGTLVYLNVDGDLDGVLRRIPKAGGAVLKPRTSIGEHGFIALIRDSEGNVVGLHSMQ